MRRTTLIACAVLLVAGVGVGGLWASADRYDQRGKDVASEIADLKRSEATRRPTTAKASAPALCRKLKVTKRGIVGDESLDELSGLSPASSTTAQTGPRFWAIEDSGAQPVLSGLRENGSLAGSWSVPGAENVDWEDIATVPGKAASGGTGTIYAADIGDNDAVRDSVSVYRIAQPTSMDGGGATAPAQRLELTYPDGARDAETLLVDPVRGTLVIVTKGLGGGTAYALSAPLPFGGQATLRKVGPVNVLLATAGAVSADGSTIAVRGYFSLSVWARKRGEAITQTLRRKPCTSPTALDDGQGESLALSAGGTTAWTVAEGTNPTILRLRAAK